MEKYLKSYVVKLKDGRTIETWDAMDVDPEEVECLLPRADYVNAVVYPAISAYRELIPILLGFLKSKNRKGVRKTYGFVYDSYEKYHKTIKTIRENEKFLNQIFASDNVDLIFDFYRGEYLMRRVYKMADPYGKEFGTFMNPLPPIEFDPFISGLTWLERNLLKSLLIDPNKLKKIKLILHTLRFSFMYKKHPGIVIDPLYMEVKYTPPMTEDEMISMVTENM